MELVPSVLEVLPSGLDIHTETQEDGLRQMRPADTLPNEAARHLAKSRRPIATQITGEKQRQKLLQNLRGALLSIIINLWIQVSKLTRTH